MKTWNIFACFFYELSKLRYHNFKKPRLSLSATWLLMDDDLRTSPTANYTSFVRNIRVSAPVGLSHVHSPCSLMMIGLPRHQFQRETASYRSRHASWHMRDARSVMHVGIDNPQWRRKRSRNSCRMRNPQFNISGKRPTAKFQSDYVSRWDHIWQM